MSDRPRRATRAPARFSPPPIAPTRPARGGPRKGTRKAPRKTTSKRTRNLTPPPSPARTGRKATRKRARAAATKLASSKASTDKERKRENARVIFAPARLSEHQNFSTSDTVVGDWISTRRYLKQTDMVARSHSNARHYSPSVWPEREWRISNDIVKATGWVANDAFHQPGSANYGRR